MTRYDWLALVSILLGFASLPANPWLALAFGGLSALLLIRH